RRSGGPDHDRPETGGEKCREKRPVSRRFGGPDRSGRSAQNVTYFQSDRAIVSPCFPDFLRDTPDAPNEVRFWRQRRTSGPLRARPPAVSTRLTASRSSRGWKPSASVRT